MLKIALLIPIYNGLEYTKACLKSIHLFLDKNSSQQANFSIVVIDDASTDGSYEWISSNYPSVHLLKGTGNLWWSGGINLGVRYAIDQLAADYILWWNNDIISDPNYFKNLIHVLENNETSTVIGSKIYLAQKENTVWSMGGLFDPYTGEKDMIGRGVPDSESFNEIVECDWLPGMGTVIHRSVYDKIGMLDEKNFPQYHGDSDFTYRAKLAGFNIIVNPTLKIYNDTRNSGLKHDESLKKLMQSLFSTKSNFNIRKNVLFYRKYVKSIKAYKVLFKNYFKYIGGFFKWKILGLLGVKRKIK